MDDGGAGFHINWVSVPIFLVLAVAVALYARHVSGSWMRPWITIKPVWWFLLLFLVPFIGLPLLAVNLFVHRHAPGAITGQRAVG